ncbi:MAG TPA: DUF1015 domain-containing protein [Candidatus Dormibacteraeota bacterium]|nr:DUF1015 domain-containing protein [Candidatus Dormibacteraeota bacterium]
MAEVSAFRGLLYQPSLVQLDSVLAPPYDVIHPQLQLELYGRALQNVVRIELGRDFEGDVPGERDRYTRARDHLHAWLQEGVLVQDELPSVYVHRHSFRPPGGGGPRERLGCFVGVEPVAHERREVLRHELTMTAPRADRLRLLEATRVQTSPIFMLYEDAPAVTARLVEIVSAEAPFAEAVVAGEYGSERHQLWRASNPEIAAQVSKGLSQTRLFIADGHHRYETALNLGLRQVLTLVSPLADPGNVILPTHRVVPQATRGVDSIAAELARRGWRREPASTVSEALALIGGLRAQAHAFGLIGTTGAEVVSRPRRSNPSPVLRLDVAVLEREILEPLLGIGSDAAAAGAVRFTRDAQEAHALALALAGVALLVNPPSVAEMAAVAVADEAMPQKSTYFFPKVPAGLVLMALD